MELQISFNDVDIIDGYYYAASNIHNGLYRFNEEGCELICRFENEADVANLFMQTILYNNKIIFTPSSANFIYIYDIDNSEMVQIPFIDKMVRIAKFHGVTIWKNFAIFVCHNYPGLVMLDLKTYELEYWEMPIKILCSEGNDIMPGLTYGYVANDKLYAVRIFTNTLLELELKTGVARKRKINHVGEKIWGYYIDGDIEYIVSSDGFFVLKNGSIVLKEKIENLDKDGYLFSTCMSDKSIYFIPFKSYYSSIPFKIARYGDASKRLEIQSIIRKNNCMFGCVKQTRDRLYMLASRNGAFIEYKIEEDIVILHKSTIKMKMEIESDMYKLSEWITLL